MQCVKRELPESIPFIKNKHSSITQLESSLSIYSANPLAPARTYTTTACIDLGRLKHNVRILQRRAGPAEIMAVVKANAYGHGALRVVQTLIEEGIQHFMVATLSEALHLRQQRIYAPILIATPPLPANLSLYSELGFHVSASTPEACKAILKSAQAGHSFDVHVKLDTGLHRLGLTLEEARSFINEASGHSSISLRGIWTHLATAGNPDTAFARHQVECARSILSQIPEFDGYFHAGNTSSLIHEERYVQPQPNIMYRCGGGLLGISAIPARAREVGLLPILTLKSYVLATKSLEAGDSVSYGRRWETPEATRIAIVGAGYADGYPGTFLHATPKNSPMATVKSKRYPIVGSICMDMCIVDLGPNTREPLVKPGDEVILFGEGGEDLSTLAAISGRKAYEISCGISQRVVKTYK